MSRVALSLVAILLSLGPSAHACRRAALSLPEAFARAHAVFVGRVVAVHKTPVDAARCAKRPDWCVYDHTAEVVVETVWKGALPERTTVFTGNGAGDCSFGAVATGDRWLFMASAVSGHAQSRTTAPFAISHAYGTVRATKANVARVTARYGAPTPPR